jgi:hypothetical protein
MSRHHPRFHIEKLKPFNDDSTRFPTRRQINRPVAEVIDKIKEYEVQEILDERETKEKGLEYRVLWLGYPVEDATWERAGYLKNSPEIIKEWKRKKQNQTITHRKEREKKEETEEETTYTHRQTAEEDEEEKKYQTDDEGVEESEEKERREWDRGYEQIRLEEEEQKQGEAINEEELSREREAEEEEEKEEKWSIVPLRRSKRVHQNKQYQQMKRLP